MRIGYLQATYHGVANCVLVCLGLLHRFAVVNLQQRTRRAHLAFKRSACVMLRSTYARRSSFWWTYEDDTCRQVRKLRAAETSWRRDTFKPSISPDL